MKRSREGSSLVEVAAAMWMGGLVGALMMTLLRAESRVAGHSADRAEVLDATRTAAAILATDLGAIEPASDVQGMGGDSVALRVFRGTGIVCGQSGAEAFVRYRGLRQPDPAKDSVLVLTSVERADSLHAVTAAPGVCVAAEGETVFRVRLALAIAPGDALLVFETGSYHVDGALRYRRGAGGRQPITAEVFTGASRFATLGGAAGPPEAITLELDPKPSAGLLRGRALAERARLRIALRNGGPP